MRIIKLAWPSPIVAVFLATFSENCIASSLSRNSPRMSYEWESNLFRRLFADYVKDARPAIELGATVNINVDMMIMKINELVERDQEIILSGFLKISWTDDRLSWSPTDYGGIEWIVVPSSRLWLPDVGLINSADMYSITRDYRFPAVVDHTGGVIWVPAGKFAARCELDVTYFPFDNQTCYFRFESWSYPSDFLNITSSSMVLSGPHYVQDQQWRITGVKTESYVVSYEAGLYSFSRIEFLLRLHRKPLYYVTYTMLPALALSTLQVCSHLLPVADSNRIAFATTTLIAFSVIHVSVSEHMPKTSDSVPLIAIYVDVVMGLIASSLIEAFLIANCLERTQETCPPRWLWIMIVDVFGKIVLIRSKTHQSKYEKLRRLLNMKDSKPEKKENLPEIKLLKVSPNLNRRDNRGDGCENNGDSALLSPSNAGSDNWSHPRPSGFNYSYSNNTNVMQYSGDCGGHHNQCELCAVTVQTMNNLSSDLALLRRLVDELTIRHIRELSRDCWNLILTVVDRYIFMLAVAVGILTPFYLFIVIPPEPESSILPEQ